MPPAPAPARSISKSSSNDSTVFLGRGASATRSWSPRSGSLVGNARLNAGLDDSCLRALGDRDRMRENASARTEGDDAIRPRYEMLERLRAVAVQVLARLHA